MGAYSIAEAKDKLSGLVKQVEEGEDVAITRHGKVVAYLRPAAERARRNRAMNWSRRSSSAPNPGRAWTRTLST